MAFTIEIQGDRKVSQQFDKFPQIAHDRLKERITALSYRLLGMILEREPFRSGRLQDVTNVVKVFDNPGRNIRGFVTVSGDFAKVAALEYGSHKSIEVNLPPGRRRARQAHRSLEADLKIPRGLGKQYTRQTNLVAQRFLRGALADIADDAIIEMQEAVEQATRQAFPS